MGKIKIGYLINRNKLKIYYLKLRKIDFHCVIFEWFNYLEDEPKITRKQLIKINKFLTTLGYRDEQDISSILEEKGKKDVIIKR